MARLEVENRRQNYTGYDEIGLVAPKPYTQLGK